MRVLVTGVAGFLGSHVAERLVARGDEVVGLDNFDPFYARAIKERNLAGVRAQMIEGDLCDAELVDKVVGRGFDAVVHLAALAGVRPSIEAPARYHLVNVVGTAYLAEAMARHGVERLVFASSSSVYGDSATVPYTEEQRVDDPASPYAASKRAGELLLKTFVDLHGISVSALRYFTVYGPRQRPEMAIHKFSRLVEAGAPVPMFGDGTSSRDYTYVDDAVDGTIAALDRAPVGWSLYNLGNTQPIALARLIELIGDAVGKIPRIDQQPAQPGDVLRTCAAIDAARRDLGYAPQVGIEEGLRRFVDWMRS